MKHLTYKQVSPSVYSDTSFRSNLITPLTCGVGEFVTIGNRNTITAVFIKSVPLAEETSNFNELFNLYHPSTMCSILQYNNSLGGYLYTWANM